MVVHILFGAVYCIKAEGLANRQIRVLSVFLAQRRINFEPKIHCYFFALTWFLNCSAL